MSALKKSALPRVVSDVQSPISNTGYNLHADLYNVKRPDWVEKLYDPILIAGRSGNFAGFERDLLSALEQKNFQLFCSEYISIDKISMLLPAPKYHEKRKSDWWYRFGVMIDSGSPSCIMNYNQGLYSSSCKWYEDYFIQWKVNRDTEESVRIEFNPNKANLTYLSAFFSAWWCYPDTLKNVKVTRLDVAIDYARYLNPVCWVCSNTSVSQSNEFNGKVKTRYFGAKNSDVQIRIYDKAKQLQDEEKITLNFSLWRCEAVIKSWNKEELFLLNEKLVSSFNPFDRLEYADAFGFDYEGQGRYSLFIEACRSRGSNWALKQLDYRTQKTYLARMKADSSKTGTFHLPGEIYKNCFAVVYREFKNLMEYLFSYGRDHGIQELPELV